MLKGAMVGGPSIVFKRFHEAGVTQIRPHRFKKSKKCRRIIGYDANALYLSTMLREMPGGKGEVKKYTGKEGLERVKDNKWFGFAEVDIEIPQKLWMKFEEMPPFFFTRQIPEQAVPQHMKDYMERTGRKRGDGKKLVGGLSEKKLLLYAPLLRWYVNHGAVITAVYRTIDYQPTKVLKWFVDEVTDARRTGDVDKSKALLADIFKLLGNSSYGKMIEAVERHPCTIYTKDEKLVDRTLRSAFFEDLDEIGGAYELESRKARVHIKRPFQIGIAVYQLAKLRMLEFYYDFLDIYVDRRDFELIQMDTDSNYMAISGEKLEDIIRPELRAEFEATKKQWLAWDKWSGRTPGLFKLESEGSGMIALCSKYYFAKGEKNKFSTKGMSKKQNEINWQRFKAALNGSIDRAENRGFRMVGKHMMTYEQHKLGLSAYYDKRWVLSRWYSHRADRVSHGRQLSIRRHNQKLFANKATLGPVRQIINNRLIRFCHIFDNLVDFQRPDWICRSFGSALKFTRLIQIPHMDERWKSFFVHTNRPRVRSGRFCNNTFLFDCSSRSFASQASHLIIQSADNIGQSFHPHSRPSCMKRLNGILMTKQALSKRAIETLDNCLISVNLSAAATNVSLVFVHFFRDAAHELAARINLQH